MSTVELKKRKNEKLKIYDFSNHNPKKSKMANNDLQTDCVRLDSGNIAEREINECNIVLYSKKGLIEHRVIHENESKRICL